jgi:hypothetical protein
MLGILGGILAGLPGIAASVLNYLTTRNNVDLQKLQAAVGADRDIMIAQLQAEIAANQAKASILQLPGVRILLFMMYAPCILHLCVIVLGRMHFIAWDVMDFLDWEKQIILSLVILVPAQSGVGAFTRWVHK